MSVDRTPHPEDVKAALRKQGSSLAQIARELDVSIQAVSAVLYGKVTSERIEEALTKAIAPASGDAAFVQDSSREHPVSKRPESNHQEL